MAEDARACKCRSDPPIRIGDFDYDPCVYVTKEVWRNATVEVMQCAVCGHIEITWHRQDDTVDITEDWTR